MTENNPAQIAGLFLTFQHSVLVISNIFSDLNDKVTTSIFIVH